MALIANKWTISGLSAELKRYRRTVAKIIDDGNVAPVEVGKTKAKIKYYLIADIVSALIGSKDLELSQERAQLVREQTRRLEMENDQREGMLIPAELVTEAIHASAKIVIPLLDNLTTDIKRRLPGTTSKQIRFFENDIAKCRNAIAETKIR